MNPVSSTWKQRESDRFNDGTYKPVPVTLDYPDEHYVHISVKHEETDHVAYTPSDAYGQADRQVSMKFGRYLKKTFSDMTDADIQGYVTKFKSALSVQETPVTLRFATDRETINDIFEAKMYACGSSVCSCMHGKFDGDSIRPYHVYADSPDVAIAYATTEKGIVSRSVVSTKDKVYVRLYSVAYGDNDADCGTLRELLEQAGYDKGELYGNRLTKLNSDCVMLPYIDNSGRDVRDDGQYWTVVESGDYTADCTDGTATDNQDRCSGCNEPEDDCECIWCECCDERYANGCDTCSRCEHCERCVHHDRCECVRCDDCNELTDDCECEPEEDDDDEEETPETPETECVTLTPQEARLKLNRIYVYLRDAHHLDWNSPEYQLLKKAFDSINHEELAA